MSECHMDIPEPGAGQQEQRGNRWWLLIAILACCLSTFIVRWHTWDEPLEADETMYLLIVQEVMHGKQLYTDVYDNKPVGCFMLLHAVAKVAGLSHNMMKATGLASMILGGCLLLGMLEQRRTLIGYAVLWGLMNGIYRIHANGSNAEVLMMPMITGTLFSTYCAIRRKEAAWVWLGMVLVSAACLIKLTALPYAALPIAGWMVSKGPRWQKVLHLIGACCLALVLWILAFRLYGVDLQGIRALLSDGGEYVAYHVSGLRHYGWLVKQMVKHEALRVILLILCISTLVFSLHYIRILRQNQHCMFHVICTYQKEWLTLLFFLCTLVAIFLPAKINPHYWVLAIPAICLMIDTVVAAIPRKSAWGYLICVMVCLSIYLGTAYFSKTPNAISEEKYDSIWFTRDRRIGTLFAEAGYKGLTVFADGSHHSAIFYSGNRAATRYMAIWFLMMGKTSVEETMYELEASPPQALMLLDMSYMEEKGFGDRLRLFADEYYEQVMVTPTGGRFMIRCDLLGLEE